MTDTPPLTDQQLDAIEAAINGYRLHPTTGFNCCSAHPVADAGAALVAEVRRLAAELDAEKQAHRFTLRQRNNRSQRLMHLRNLANTAATGGAADVAALIAAARDTLAASVDDHTACGPDDEGLHGPCDCGEGAVHYTAADCPAAQRTAGAQQ